MWVYIWADDRWQPWANTLLYFPLTDNSTDTQNNVSLNSTWTVTYTTPTWVNKKCAYFDGSSYLYNSSVSTSYLPQWASARTMSLWLNFTWAIPTNYASICGYGNESMNQMFNIIKFIQNTFANSNSFNLSQYWTQPETWTFIVPQQNTWYNLVTTYDNWVRKLYINNSLDISWTYTINTTWWHLYLWNRHWGAEVCWAWYASNFIIEDVAWSSQDVSDYYNLTKWDYWL